MLENLGEDLSGDASTFGGKGKTINFFSIVFAFGTPGIELALTNVRLKVYLSPQITHRFFRTDVDVGLPDQGAPVPICVEKSQQGKLLRRSRR